MDRKHLLLLIVAFTPLVSTVSGLECLTCFSVDDKDAENSECYAGTGDIEAQGCGILSTCGHVTGLADVVPKDNPTSDPVRKKVAARMCVPLIATVRIHPCTTDASPYYDQINNANDEYNFSNFEGDICICGEDRCTSP